MKFRVKISGFSILICIALLIFSCKKMLELPNDSLLPEDKAFVDEFSARSAVMGVYASLQDVAEQLVILGELQGDLLTVTENAGNDLRQLNDHTAGASNEYADPSGFFRIIMNCNEVIDKIHRAKDNDKNISNLEYANFLGELKLIRAWVYFKMVQIYGNVPYFEEPLSDYNRGTAMQEKLNTLQTEDYILDTLLLQLASIDTFDLNLLEESPFYSIRVKKYTNWALQGDIYLWRNNYAYAKKMYDKVINIMSQEGWLGTSRLPYIVSWNYQDVNWKSMFQFNYSSDAFETEAIFVIPFSKLYNQQHSLQHIFNYGEGGDYLLRPTDFIINLYQAQQVIRYEVQPDHKRGDPGDLNRGKGVSYDSIGGNAVVTKYSLFRESFDNDAGIFVYRTADFHLKTCESYARSKKGSDAISHLNEGLLYASAWGTGTRIRANLTGIGVEDPRIIESVEDLIMDERAMELAFEGHRWFDLVRIARHRNDPSYLAEKVAAKFSDMEKRAEVKSYLMDMNNWYLPLKSK